MLEFKKKEDGFVDAIEEGKIVKVSEDYARREGLLVLRKSFSTLNEQKDSPKKEESIVKSKSFTGMDDFRRPLSSKANELMKELVENFHWILSGKRKERGLTRKKVADDVGEREENIKIIENGVLPADNFVLVNKLEGYYGIDLKKNKSVNIIKNAGRQTIDFPGGKNAYSEKAPEIEEVRVARTPKWVTKRFGDGKKKDDSEIEIIEEETLSDEKSEGDSASDLPADKEGKIYK